MVQVGIEGGEGRSRRSRGRVRGWVLIAHFRFGGDLRFANAVSPVDGAGPAYGFAALALSSSGLLPKPVSRRSGQEFQKGPLQVGQIDAILGTFGARHAGNDRSKIQFEFGGIVNLTALGHAKQF
jgi:hypothetical protein